MENVETRDDRHDGGDFFGLPPAPPSRDAAHNGHAAADAAAMRESRSSPATRPTTSASVASSMPEHVEDLAVRVAVRARPLVAKERAERARECLSYPKANAVVLGESRAFRFDDVFGPAATQGEVYDRLVSPLVESCFRGYNATVLAYGQTGSGKTYTMGSGCADLADDQIGVAPRVVADVFAEALRRAETGESDVRVRCAFLEVHNEEVRDLLHPDVNPKRISIRERADGAIVAAGAREAATRSSDEMLRLLELGCVARTTGGTKMNAQSSRSHAIFTIIIEQTHLTREVRRRHGGDCASAKFHLVDLAGSERNKKTRAAGSRFQESININSGLLALGNVIAALSGDDANRTGVVAKYGKTHVPYRDSKLTRLLQDSLGGNSRTCVVACVSPVDTNFEETLNTLKYAQRARNIKNAIKVNRDPDAARVAAYKTEPEPEKSAAARAAHPERRSDGVRATPSPRDVSSRADALERVLVRALVLAGELADSKQLTQVGLARLAACATERARSMATAESRAGRPFPRASDAEHLSPTETRAANEHARARVVPRDDDDASSASTTAHLRAQLEALRRKVAEVTAASAAKDSALAEARDDLRRDEAIFADKMREIKALKKQAKSVAKASAARLSPGHLVSASASEIGSGTAPLTPSANDETNAAGTLPPLGGGALPATPLGGGPGAFAPFPDAADSEKRALVAQKAEIELERAQLKREAARRARAYQQEKKSLERQLRELARNIGSKEKLIVDLTRNEREAALLTRRYEDKVRSLEEEKASKEAEAARLRSELLAVERAAQETERSSSSENARAAAEARDATRRAYEKKVRAAEAEVRALRLAKAESDALRANTETLVATEPERKAERSKTRELETEIAKMRADAEALRARLRERESRTEGRAEDGADADARAADAFREPHDAEAMRRLTDELAAAKVTIRRLGGADGEGRSRPSPSGASRTREGNGNVSESEQSLPPETVSAVRALVDAETAKALARREREEERARLDAKREALLGEKRGLHARRDALLGAPDALASGEATPRVAEQRELRDAEDRADAVDAELEFVAAKLEELAALDRTETSSPRRPSSGKDDDFPDDFSSLVAAMPVAAARAAAAAAMARAVRTGLARSETAASAARLEMQLGDAQRAIEEMESASRMREMEFDRRVTELRLEHGRREAALLALSERARLAREDRRESREKGLASQNLDPGDARGSVVDVDAIVADAEVTRRRNASLRDAVSSLERERAELESAGRALEDKLERSSREAQRLRERVARLANAPGRVGSLPLDRHREASPRRVVDDENDRLGDEDVVTGRGAPRSFPSSRDHKSVWSEDDAESLAPEDDDRDDGVSGGVSGGERSLPEPPRLPATPVGVPRVDGSRRGENVFGVDASDAAARFALLGMGAAAAGSIRKAGAA